MRSFQLTKTHILIMVNTSPITFCSTRKAISSSPTLVWPRISTGPMTLRTMSPSDVLCFARLVLILRTRTPSSHARNLLIPRPPWHGTWTTTITHNLRVGHLLTRASSPGVTATERKWHSQSWVPTTIWRQKFFVALDMTEDATGGVWE